MLTCCNPPYSQHGADGHSIVLVFCAQKRRAPPGDTGPTLRVLLQLGCAPGGALSDAIASDTVPDQGYHHFQQIHPMLVSESDSQLVRQKCLRFMVWPSDRARKNGLHAPPGCRLPLRTRSTVAPASVSSL